jgi:hypothetical protein
LLLTGDYTQNPLQRPMSDNGIFRQPFEHLTELQRHSAAIVARPGEARLDDYASSLAILPECSLVRIVEEERDCPIRIGGLNVWDHASSRLHEPRLEPPHPQLSIAAPRDDPVRDQRRQLSDPRTTGLMDTTPPWLAIAILQQPARSRSAARLPNVPRNDQVL